MSADTKATATQAEVKEGFDSWAIVELMGHVRIAGRVTEEERFGCKMGRIDIPGPDGQFVTQYFGGSSVYRVTPTTEEIARAVAVRNQPEPVHQWEMPKGLKPAREVELDYVGSDGDDDDDRPDPPF
jgi:hypothetical protein